MPAYNDSKIDALALNGKLSGRRSLALLRLLLATVITLISCACSEKKDLPEIGEHIARPIDVAYHQASQHFFVLNSNLNHTYNTGSLLLLARDGQQQAAVAIPRLGRSLSLAGNLLLVTFDKESGDDTQSQVILYEIEPQADGGVPKLTERKSWALDDCSPINGVIRQHSSYLAVSCQTGKIFAGKLERQALDQSSLQLVRQFPSFVRRAIYLDTRHDLLYAFVTDMRDPTFMDTIFKDDKTWDPKLGKHGEVVEGSNEVPDDLEADRFSYLRLKERASHFQFVVYDLRQAEADRFPFKEYKDVLGELRWLYFNDEDSVKLDANQKYYRSNFWQAQPLPAADAADDGSADVAFYLSQRGLGLEGKSQHANNIIKVTVGDDRAAILDPTVPTKDVFGFTKAYGKLKVQRPDNTYLNGFGVASFGEGREAFVVNSFRDLVYFDTQRYALTIADTNAADEGAWVKHLESGEASDSYFQLAVSDADADQAVHVLTCSFYGDAIILFKLAWQEEFKLVKRIN